MAALIRNKSTETISLPYPFRGILGPGDGTVIDASAATVLAALGPVSGDSTLKVSDVDSDQFDSFRTNVLVEGFSVEPLKAADVADLATIDDTSLPEGARARPATLLQDFTLDKTSTATADGITVAPTKSGTGRWLRLLVPVPRWTDQVDWEVNSSTGDDENPGTTGLPLKTLAEFCRRTRVLKYGTGFGPYVILVQNDIPASDTFGLSSDVQIVGALANEPARGVTSPIVRIVGGTAAVASSGSLTAFVAPSGNAKSTIARLSGSWVVGDVVQFTSGDASGIRAYITEVTGATLIGGVNPHVFDPFSPTVPANLDTFDVITLKKLGPEITNAGGPSGVIIEVENCEIPDATGSYEANNCTLLLLHCLCRVLIRPGIGSRVRFGNFASKPCAFIRPSLDFLNVERGSVISFMTTWVNVIIEPTQLSGIYAGAYEELQGGAVRMGNAGEEAEGAQGAVAGTFGPTRIFDYPTTIPANPNIGTGGTGDPGAAFSIRRGAQLQLIGDFAGNNVVGTSGNAGTSGLNLSEGAHVEIVGSTPTVTGAASDIIMDAGDSIPKIAATGVPTAGAALTSWGTGANGWAEVAGLNFNAHNLKNGTLLIRTP